MDTLIYTTNANGEASMRVSSTVAGDKTSIYGVDKDGNAAVRVTGDVGGGSTPSENCVTKEELAKTLKDYVKTNVKEGSDLSYMNNEPNGGIMKYTRADGGYSKVTLWDDEGIAEAQIVVTNQDKTKFAKIDARQTGIYYSKKSGKPDESEEIATKGDVAKCLTKDEAAADYVQVDELARDYLTKADSDAKFALKSAGLPTPPFEQGTYVLKCVVDDAGAPSFTWVLEG